MAEDKMEFIKSAHDYISELFLRPQNPNGLFTINTTKEPVVMVILLIYS